jgi:hypothetical protein
MAKIKLGDEVKDKFTDFKGKVTARTEYITGCVQYEVQPRELKDGMLQDPAWIDEIRLEIIKKEPTKKAPRRHGGIRSHPPRR